MTADTAGKIRGWEAAAAWRRARTGPVVFTNGVFDLLHPGHVELLEAARREGAALVVGLNTDASARRLGKGPERPVAGEAARARVLAGLAAVDCVVLFDQDTPLQLIQHLAPDVIVKGADYTRDRIVGADWVEARGGRVVRIPVVAGFSTSALVERLRASS
ncbi:MAG TPA: D-glycero-beta-D-manno-heptose 1-phosphate adenylyltransferase [Gemmatimonadales bacterium]|nr:D-glycero-beta-D-manno-heptose 1-phosphate adenylyltransferase [Gemmatimonadales bacterium]